MCTGAGAGSGSTRFRRRLRRFRRRSGIIAEATTPLGRFHKQESPNIFLSSGSVGKEMRKQCRISLGVENAFQKPTSKLGWLWVRHILPSGPNCAENVKAKLVKFRYVNMFQQSGFPTEKPCKQCLSSGILDRGKTGRLQEKPWNRPQQLGQWAACDLRQQVVERIKQHPSW